MGARQTPNEPRQGGISRTGSSPRSQTRHVDAFQAQSSRTQMAIRTTSLAGGGSKFGNGPRRRGCEHALLRRGHCQPAQRGGSRPNRVDSGSAVAGRTILPWGFGLCIRSPFFSSTENAHSKTQRNTPGRSDGLITRPVVKTAHRKSGELKPPVTPLPHSENISATNLRKTRTPQATMIV